MSIFFSKNNFSFCKTYPQYAKFFTLESNLLMNLDGFTMSKFVVIMDTMSYLLLDFNDKPKRLDRFVGYIAMVHKDMRLDETDMYVRGNLLLNSSKCFWNIFPRQI